MLLSLLSVVAVLISTISIYARAENMISIVTNNMVGFSI